MRQFWAVINSLTNLDFRRDWVKNQKHFVCAYLSVIVFSGKLTGIELIFIAHQRNNLGTKGNKYKWQLPWPKKLNFHHIETNLNSINLNDINQSQIIIEYFYQCHLKFSIIFFLLFFSIHNHYFNFHILLYPKFFHINRS